MTKQHKYTEEQREFIKNNVKGTLIPDLLKMFNKEFGTKLKYGQMKSYMGNHKLSNGLQTTFRKGLIPWNTGTKGLTKANKTSFKKGQKPHNYKPIGSERICSKDGYILVKTETGWKPKHRVLWEKENGKIPKGYYLMFLDGDIYNMELNNLALISKAENLILNSRDLRNKNPELTLTGLNVAKVQCAINGAKKRRKINGR